MKLGVFGTDGQQRKVHMLAVPFSLSYWLLRGRFIDSQLLCKRSF